MKNLLMTKSSDCKSDFDFAAADRGFGSRAVEICHFPMLGIMAYITA